MKNPSPIFKKVFDEHVEILRANIQEHLNPNFIGYDITGRGRTPDQRYTVVIFNSNRHHELRLDGQVKHEVVKFTFSQYRLKDGDTGAIPTRQHSLYGTHYDQAEGVFSLMPPEVKLSQFGSDPLRWLCAIEDELIEAFSDNGKYPVHIHASDNAAVFVLSERRLWEQHRIRIDRDDSIWVITPQYFGRELGNTWYHQHLRDKAEKEKAQAEAAVEKPKATSLSSAQRMALLGTVAAMSTLPTGNK